MTTTTIPAVTTDDHHVTVPTTPPKLIVKQHDASSSNNVTDNTISPLYEASPSTQRACAERSGARPKTPQPPRKITAVHSGTFYSSLIPFMLFAGFAPWLIPLEPVTSRGRNMLRHPAARMDRTTTTHCGKGVGPLTGKKRPRRRERSARSAGTP